MTDDLSEAIEDAYPCCPRCGERLDDAGADDQARLRCPTCGLDVIG